VLVSILGLVEQDDAMGQIHMSLPFQGQDLILAHTGIQGCNDDRR
jgi:hypothetical protein